jgi:adenine-specific DNA methylase
MTAVQALFDELIDNLYARSIAGSYEMEEFIESYTFLIFIFLTPA